MRVGVLSNLRAGGSGARVAQVLSRLSKYPEVIRAESSSAEGAGDAIRSLADAGVDVLVVNGGDGTLQRALTELLCAGSAFRKLPVVAPLRTGRTSMSALDIGSPGDPLTAIDRVIGIARAGQVEQHLVQRAVLRMILEPDGIDHYGTFFGGGVIYRAIHLTHGIFPKGRAQGVFGSSIITATLLGRVLTGSASEVLSPDHVEVHTDGERLEQTQYQLLLATTLDRLFLRLRPFWGSGPGGIRFTGIAPGGFHHPGAVSRLVRGRSPTNGRVDRRYVSANVESVVMTFDSGATLDGEMFDPLPGRKATLIADHRIRFLGAR
ncbi:MAG TPA: diacylglycerol kinase family protein [Candidatus Binatia bacterium]|nr:diacylglycerol kinase family protein [Candidatus Binatia bacterium]